MPVCWAQHTVCMAIPELATNRSKGCKKVLNGCRQSLRHLHAMIFKPSAKDQVSRDWLKRLFSHRVNVCYSTAEELVGPKGGGAAAAEEGGEQQAGGKVAAAAKEDADDAQGAGEKELSKRAKKRMKRLSIAEIRWP